MIFLNSNLYIDNLMGHGEQYDGLFYTSHDSRDIEFTVYNMTLNNLKQLSKSESSIFYIDKNNIVNMDG